MNLKIELIPKTKKPEQEFTKKDNNLNLFIKNVLSIHSLHRFSHMEELKNQLELDYLIYGKSFPS